MKEKYKTSIITVFISLFLFTPYCDKCTLFYLNGNPDCLAISYLSHIEQATEFISGNKTVILLQLLPGKHVAYHRLVVFSRLLLPIENHVETSVSLATPLSFL